MIDPIYRTEKYCQLSNDTIKTYNETTTCLIYSNDDKISDHKAEPNIALLSLILLIGTCTLALALKKLRRSIFFGAYVSKLARKFETKSLKELKKINSLKDKKNVE